jgi:predicted adenine nucleotide alpha hydrolase (AANH) superfamily ATPase
VDKLRQDGHKVEGFFYNPNIAPLAEYKLRREAVAAMAKRMNLKVEYRDSLDVGATLVVALKGQGQALPLQKAQRCINCWRRRLAEASKTAKQAEFDAFSTTLLISPYQNHDEIRLIGNELGKEAKVYFYYEDFRPGFKTSQNMAREQGLYMQKYCGCEYSIEEAQTPITRGQV